MDLNQLYFDHQVLRMQADRATSSEARGLHDRGAALLAGRIGCMQQAVGAYAAASWTAIAMNDPANPCFSPSASPARYPIPLRIEQGGAVT